MSANAQTSMSIQSFKDTAVLLSPATSVLLRANHGVGKSQVVRQVRALLRDKIAALKDSVVIDMSQYKDLKKDFYGLTDRRLSQMTEGDMIGLPSINDNCTRFNPPDWYKQACDRPMVLFLDELNRATNEVMQAAFQIVLDRELNGWKLHPLTRVYAAINMGANYTVNEMDPALLDRFWVVDLEPTLDDFIVWCRNTDPEQGGNINECIPGFMLATKRTDGSSWLYPAKKAESNSRQPSPRSWAAVNRELTLAGIIENPAHPAFWQICRGFVGNEAAIAFTNYCKTIDRQISGKEVVNDYHKKGTKAKVLAAGVQAQNEIIERVVAYVFEELTTLADQQGKNIAALMADLPEELQVSLWGKLTSQGTEKAKLALAVHKHCMPLVFKVFGVKPGEEGIGQVPHIPGIFRPPPAGAPGAKKPNTT